MDCLSFLDAFCKVQDDAFVDQYAVDVTSGVFPSCVNIGSATNEVVDCQSVCVYFSFRRSFVVVAERFVVWSFSVGVNGGSSGVV
jgi:hypothetical protein